MSLLYKLKSLYSISELSPKIVSIYSSITSLETAFFELCASISEFVTCAIANCNFISLLILSSSELNPVELYIAYLAKALLFPVNLYAV